MLMLYRKKLTNKHIRIFASQNIYYQTLGYKFVKICPYLEKLQQKNKGVPIIWNALVGEVSRHVSRLIHVTMYSLIIWTGSRDEFNVHLRSADYLLPVRPSGQ